MTRNKNEMKSPCYLPSNSGLHVVTIEVENSKGDVQNFRYKV